MNHSDFVRKYSFDNPLQRLVMLRILMGGSMDGEGASNRSSGTVRILLLLKAGNV